MSKRIVLIRHVESLKNTLNACSSLDGREPVTKYGRYQASAIAEYLKKEISEWKGDTLLFTAEDNRSRFTATVISGELNLPIKEVKALSPYTSSEASGVFLDDLFSMDRVFKKRFEAYRAGLISAWDVPWPTGDTSEMQRMLESFADEAKLIGECNAIVVGHKSTLTCLAFVLLRRLGCYPDEFYGYVDIKPGHGIVIEIENGVADVACVDFGAEEKKIKTDVVVRDGRIVFPLSACAVCWRNDKLLLIQQSRSGGLTWELPGGKLVPEEEPEKAAKRELFEETGYIGENGRMLFDIDLDLSISIHKTYLVVFDDIKETTAVDAVKVRWFSMEELGQMIAESKITHAQTVLAYLSKKGG